MDHFNTRQDHRPPETLNAIGRRAFTLIELLVVISIIALLIGILLPALSAARDSARGVKCLSGLKQMGFAALAYADENNGLLPHGYLFDTSGADVSGWDTLLTGWMSAQGMTFADSVNRSEIFQCPSAGIPQGTRHYSAQPFMMPEINLSTPNPAKQYNVARLVRTTEVLMLADAVQNPTTGTAATRYFAIPGAAFQPFDSSRTNNNDPIADDGRNADLAANNGYIRYRHGSETAANGVHPDGHASSYSQGDILRRNVISD